MTRPASASVCQTTPSVYLWCSSAVMLVNQCLFFAFLFSSPLLPPFLLSPLLFSSLLRMSFIQTSVPLVFWGQCPPSHEIACICRSEEKRGVATASRSGQICIWDVCKERETEKVRVGPPSILTHAPFASHKAKAGLFLLCH